MCRTKYRFDTVKFYEQFWKLQQILCNRDYVTKSPEKWNEVRDLLSDVLNAMAEIKDIGNSDDKEKVELDNTRIYLKLEQHEIEGPMSPIRLTRRQQHRAAAVLHRGISLPPADQRHQEPAVDLLPNPPVSEPPPQLSQQAAGADGRGAAHQDDAVAGAQDGGPQRPDRGDQQALGAREDVEPVEGDARDGASGEPPRGGARGDDGG